MRNIWKLAIISALGSASALTAPAHAASDSIWDHNGSKMTLEEHGDKRKLVYTELREGLDKAGIKQGTVLFNGERKADGRLAGFAKIFKGTCNPIDYFVEGTLNEKTGKIVLQGQAPVYASGTGCEVSGYSDTSPASTLTFSKISDAPESAVIAERTPEPQIEQGDRGPADEYLPPAQRSDRYSKRVEPETTQPPSTEQQPATREDRNSADGQSRSPDTQGRSPDTQGRNRAADVDQDDPYRDDLRPRYRRYYSDPYRDRRYSRAPDPYDQRSYRRRPGIWDPQDNMDAEDEDSAYDDRWDRPVWRFWGRRRPY